MAKFILACDCGQTIQYSLDAYRIMAHTRELPDVYRIGKAYVLLDKLPKGSNIYAYVQRLLAVGGKYAYYFECDNDGNITQQWDLINGAKLTV